MLKVSKIFGFAKEKIQLNIGIQTLIMNINNINQIDKIDFISSFENIFEESKFITEIVEPKDLLKIRIT